jgi:molybdopterin-synthase adenylyltransferase
MQHLSLTKDHLTRQMDLIPMESLLTPVHIIGAGAIGSHAALSLAKMGMSDITVWDFDDVSIENMNSQGYRFKDIGQPKVTALLNIIHDYTNVIITTVPRAFEEKDAVNLKGIVVVAVDSMKARSMIYEAIKATGWAVKYIIDPRMSAEFYLQYTINPFRDDDKKTYDKTLYTDEQAVSERCTAKSTIYTATLAAGMVVKTVKDIITKADSYPRVVQWNIAATSSSLNMFAGNVSSPQDVGQDLTVALDGSRALIGAYQPPQGMTWRQISQGQLVP